MKIGQGMGRTASGWVGFCLATMFATVSTVMPAWAVEPGQAAPPDAKPPATATAAMAAATEPKPQATDPEGIYREGLEAQKIDDFLLSVNLFRRAAEGGYVPAMVKLAEVLDRAEENSQALEWYEKAVKADNPQGFLGLGVLLIGGDVGTDRVKEGLEWIRKAVDRRLAEAMVIQAGILASGRYADKEKADPEGGLKLLNEAAEIGHVPAMQELIKIYNDGLWGLQPDPAKVRQWQGRVKTALAAAKPGTKP
ncbi:MAG: hypothetical protein HW380_912 [Magnetococcales bacterium]|nr:hypothetical protein [Magnetococcales bacterium]HIJ85777.1 sel1 repeat family protein [Magnetococcales bacterium]